MIERLATRFGCFERLLMSDYVQYRRPCDNLLGLASSIRSRSCGGVQDEKSSLFRGKQFQTIGIKLL